MNSEFFKWLDENGFQSLSTKAAMFHCMGAGLAATKRVKSGSVLLSVPSKLVITPDSAYHILTSCEICRANNVFSNITCEFSSGLELLTLAVLHEYVLVGNSRFYPFIHFALPKPHESITQSEYSAQTKQKFAAFSPHFIESLERIAIPRKKISSYLREFANCHAATPASSNCFSKSFGIASSSDYQCLLTRWAAFIVNSRCVYCRRLARHSDFPFKTDAHAVLAPYFDFINHKFFCSSSDPSDDVSMAEFQYNITCDQFELIASQSYSPGEQIFIDYGSHNNATLLREYHFALEVNPNETIEISRFQRIQLPLRNGEAKDNDPDMAVLRKSLDEFCRVTGRRQTPGDASDLFLSRDGASYYLLIFLEIKSRVKRRSQPANQSRAEIRGEDYFALDESDLCVSHGAEIDRLVGEEYARHTDMLDKLNETINLENRLRPFLICRINILLHLINR